MIRAAKNSVKRGGGGGRSPENIKCSLITLRPDMRISQMSPEFEQCQDYFDSCAEMGSVTIPLVVFCLGD